MTSLNQSVPDLANVQGLVVQPYRYKLSRHLLFEFGDGGKPFLRALLPRVTTGTTVLDAGSPILCNVAVTYAGLARLGVDPNVLAQMDPFFAEGPKPMPLGDVPGSESDPRCWWEEQFAATRLHCSVQLYAQQPEDLGRGGAEVLQLAADHGLVELIPRKDGSRLDGVALGGPGRVHFGYRDGISQPRVRWDDRTHQPGDVNFRHFVLGYSTADVFSSPTEPPASDLVRDSSYMVFRWVYQDVAAFNRFLKDEGPRLAPDLATDEAEELLAAKLVGRWRDGTPLVLSPEGPDVARAKDADFNYATQDPQGLRCPFSAHIRVTNPRDQPLGPIQTDGVPRVIRRGMPYGAEMSPTEITDDGVDRGILGIFICSSIRRQFYTLTRWISETSFSPVFQDHRHGQDPLFGNRRFPGAEAEFRMPCLSGPTTITGLPDFVRTKGTSFLLLPSLSALRSMTT